MLKKTLLACALSLSLGATAQEVAVIPQPQSVQTAAGTLAVSLADIDAFTATRGTALAQQQTPKSVRITTEASLGEEGYRLVIDASGIQIAHTTPAGLFYAKQTLRQLALTTGGQLPFVTITDAPLLRHRGFMIDEARHFFGKEEVKKLIDLMAFYKLNRLHWHLTDDQGWRIEIPEYPLLTTTGAERKGSLINRGTTPWFYDDTPYGKGMFYTLSDLREVVAYAAERHIEIIPEVDLPGHMVAVLAAYPELSCKPDSTYEVRLAAGVDENVLNVGDDRAIAFLKTVLGHVATVFPGKYIHIGGDECPTKVWETNALALQRVKSEGLQSVHDLQPWLAQLLGKYLKEQYGKDIIVWDELLAHWPQKTAIRPVAMAWRGVEYAKQAADKGFESIVVPNFPLYFDLMQVDTTQAIVEEVYQGGYGDIYVNTLRHVYDLNPLAAVKGQESYVLGTQANLWAETVRNAQELEYCALPRLLALSEIAWLPAEKKDWKSFDARLQHHDEIFDAEGYVYARHYFRQPAPTAADSARTILRDACAGEIGYPSAKAYAALKKALRRGTAIGAALEAFRQAPITMPKAGQTVRFLSASTYYKRKYAGSSLYAGTASARAHFTPQGTTDELWTFVPRGTGFVLRNGTGGELFLSPEGKTSLAQYGTVFFVQRATVPFKNIRYAHGAITLTDATGRALYIAPTADIVSSLDTRLAHPATWRVETVR